MAAVLQRMKAIVMKSPGCGARAQLMMMNCSFALAMAGERDTDTESDREREPQAITQPQHMHHNFNPPIQLAPSLYVHTHHRGWEDVDWRPPPPPTPHPILMCSARVTRGHVWGRLDGNMGGGVETRDL